jgi:hypothetical protein
VASGLLSTSQNLGSVIGVAVASSVAATQSHALVLRGDPVAAALTGGFQLALWVCGLAGLAAVPVALVVIGRQKNTGPAAGQPRELVTAAGQPGDPQMTTTR